MWTHQIPMIVVASIFGSLVTCQIDYDKIEEDKLRLTLEDFLLVYEKRITFNIITLYIKEDLFSNLKFQKFLFGQWMASLVLVSNRNESNTDIQLRTSANYLTRGTTHHLTCDLVIVLVPDAHIWIDVILKRWSPSQKVLFIDLSNNLKASTSLSLQFNNNVLFADVRALDDPACDPCARELTHQAPSEPKYCLRLWETYSVTAKTERKVSVFDHWLPGMELKSIPLDLSENRRDFFGAELSCISEWDSYSVIPKTRADGTEYLIGWALEVLSEMKQLLNFSCELERSPDGTWGVAREDGTWTGMIGALATGEADIVVATVDNTFERGRVVDFLTPISITKTSFFLAVGSRFGSPWNNYTDEFSALVWGVVLICLVGGSALLVVVIHTTFQETVNWTMDESLLIVYGMLIGQGCTETPTRVSSRIVFITLLVFSILTNAHYSAFLYAKLSDTRQNIPFNSLDAILADGTYSVEIYGGSSDETSIIESDDKRIQRIYSELILPDGFFKDYSDVKTRMKNGNVMLLTSALAFETYTRSTPCDYIRLPIPVFSSRAGFAVQKYSPFKRTFDRALVQIISSGVLDKHETRWEVSPTDCSSTDGLPITFKQTTFAATVLACGMVFSLLLLAFERCLSKINRKNGMHKYETDEVSR